MALPDGTLESVRQLGVPEVPKPIAISEVSPDEVSRTTVLPLVPGAPIGADLAVEPGRRAAAREVVSLPRGAESSLLAELRQLHAGPRIPQRRGLLDLRTDDDDGLGAEAMTPLAVPSLSRLEMPDFRIAVTRRSLEFVRNFAQTKKGKQLFATWLKRSGRYEDMILEELRRWSMPEDLMWVAMIESGFSPKAKSTAGAMGLWQFMPQTGAVYGLRQDEFVDQRRNARLATQAAVKHLRDLYARFGNWELSLAAYNMGYEQLLDAIDETQTADFNELARHEAIPRETRNYVPKIVAAALVANNLEQFELDGLPVETPADLAELAVPPSTPLRVVAKSCGVSTATIKAMNPDLLRDVSPPGSDYVVQIPSEALMRAQVKLPLLLAARRANGDRSDEPVEAEEQGVREPERAAEKRLEATSRKPRGSLRHPARAERDASAGEPEKGPSKSRERTHQRTRAKREKRTG